MQQRCGRSDFDSYQNIAGLGSRTGVAVNATEDRGGRASTDVPARVGRAAIVLIVEEDTDARVALPATACRLALNVEALSVAVLRIAVTSERAPIGEVAGSCEVAAVEDLVQRH